MTDLIVNAMFELQNKNEEVKSYIREMNRMRHFNQDSNRIQSRNLNNSDSRTNFATT